MAENSEQAEPMRPDDDGRRDGRQVRMLRNRAAICDACLDLIQEGALQPSAEQIATRAGLSRRSVFNHFKDLSELYDAVHAAGMQRAAPLLAEARGDARMSLEERIDLWTTARSRFAEVTGPFTRALTAQALASPTRDQALRIAREATRTQQAELERLFAPELDGRPETERTELIEALSAVASPLVWQHLRHSRGMSPSRARGVMRRGVGALLGALGQ
jgi:AcrR family transcriptional regulator